MAVSKELLESVKLYCKIDFDFEDDVIKEMIESAQEQICFAIEDGSTPEKFKGHAKFTLAVKKQVKEEYDHRGLSADSFRYPLANGVLNIIHQLRLRGDGS
ncbi:TPA: head-tail connector protein [Streptococcus pyogenes]|uniref:head-tail connector protein n=1 Tax=Streptococcus pyogenes TaxID=1314 RepID=UPI000252E6CA|nr:head-tail connector protein [Streptococcus pyogenes]HER4685829.1 phage head-tail connector protein [Streptococcus pyogenes NGAS353]HER4760325.1 phage head-tail connector protein [Streptococcus pyogenes NGAS245]AFC68332.1 phage head-tail connector protein [Streptococcus pyogenes MGAS1882]AIL11276.1 phage gp6-like head-tail connector family protein [Streptococcus pyogenes]ESU85995.1 Phage gp6-like head-tail connector protein [Streptococcus pyogenes GA40884]